MRLSAIMLFVFAGLAFSSESYSQSTLLTLKVNNKTVQDVLDEIENQTDFHFFYNNKQVNTSRVVSLESKKENIFDVLDELFSNTDVSYKVLDKSIILSPKEILESTTVLQQNIKEIRGIIVDELGEPVIGANIMEKGSTNGTITDLDGGFNLTVPQNAVLQISYIGYIPQELRVGSASVYHIQLQEDTKNLDEVIVTALGIRREEKALGYAVQKVSGDKLNTVKTVNVATSLTGKVAGLNIKNSTEFNTNPTIYLRGEEPLLVVDGVPYRNIKLADIAADDIESIDILKGATASALYGARGGSGAIMVTTKRGGQEGLDIQINSSTMFNAGYLVLPKVQSGYSTGQGGLYTAEDFVWGDKMDIGRTAMQYDPYTYEWKEMPLVSKGKNNFKNFLETGFITNNNINITQKGKYGSFRTSLNHVYNKGQYPNQKLNKITYSVSGDMKWNNFTFEGGAIYNKRIYPNDQGAGYGGGGYIYNLLVWTGTDYDIRDYKNYWVEGREHQQQNWMNDVWYDNPYYLAHEVTKSNNYDQINTYLSAKYDFTDWLNLSLRTGVDSYTSKFEYKNPINTRGGWHKKGYFETERKIGWSINNDVILMANKKFGDFSVDGFFGGTIYYYYDDHNYANTENGLSIPGYYSLKASVDPVSAVSKYESKQVNSLYGKVSGAWKSTLFVDVTGRNDWSSTLPSETRSYFYPSVSGSLILSEFTPLPEWFNFWKLRGSWTVTKNDPKIYETNMSYSISTNVWDGLNKASYPTILRNKILEPVTSRSYEFGTGMHFFNNRLIVDIAYYNKLKYNLTREANVSPTSGFEKTFINYGEEQLRKGVEVTASGDIIRRKDFTWNATANWALDRYTYYKVDPDYSTQKPWVAGGKRWDWLGVYDWERDPEGNIIHVNGMPSMSKYESVAGNEYPDWIWGLQNTFRYKDFTLSVSFDGRVGGVVYSRTAQTMWNTGVHPDSDNQWRYDEVVNGNTSYIGQGVKVVSGSVEYNSLGEIMSDTRVFAPNDVAVSYEAYTKEFNPWSGNKVKQHILDATFIKLRELSASYIIPQSICQKAKIKGASVGFVGQNLWIWMKEFKYADPDIDKDDLNSPSMRYVGFNVKIDF